MDSTPVVLTGNRNPSPSPSFDLSKALRGMGVALLAITGVLIWREVAMDSVFLLLGTSSAAMVGSFWLEWKKKEFVGPIASIASLGFASCWYAATREPLVLIAMGMATATFAVMSWLHRERRTSTHRMIAFQGAAWSSLALTLALDFHLFHASEIGDENFLARRVILTIAWLVPGLAALVFGGKREDRALQSAGVVLTVAALGKLLFYDTVALQGVLRIASYGVAGLMTLIGGQLLTRKAPQVEVQS